jgi:hypothetical protein
MALMFGFAPISHATLVSISPCTPNVGVITCEITNNPPNPVVPNTDTDKLTAWNEVQNFTLTSNLYVDRVFDELAPIVGMDGGGTFLKSGTVVSSHYVQWDPSGTKRVNATITTDSEIFAFIYTDENLFTSDEFLGRPGIDYNDFQFRGLEDFNNDTILFNGLSTDISWLASNPGDWARMITAFSPGASEVPVPAAVWLFGTALVGFVGISRRRKVS